VADRARPMAETQKMWSRRDNRSNKPTDLAYSIAWSKYGLRPVKSRNWPLKNSSTEARSISASEMRYTVGLCFPFVRACDHSKIWLVQTGRAARRGQGAADSPLHAALAAVGGWKGHFHLFP